MSIIQMSALRSNSAIQANALPPVQAQNVTTIVDVDGEKNLNLALLEAIQLGLYLWANPLKRKTVMCKEKPARGWYKVHGVYHMPDFPPEAA